MKKLLASLGLVFTLVNSAHATTYNVTIKNNTSQNISVQSLFDKSTLGTRGGDVLKDGLNVIPGQQGTFTFYDSGWYTWEETGKYHFNFAINVISGMESNSTLKQSEYSITQYGSSGTLSLKYDVGGMKPYDTTCYSSSGCWSTEGSKFDIVYDYQNIDNKTKVFVYVSNNWRGEAFIDDLTGTNVASQPLPQSGRLPW